jgi:small subunit ribosomal protein S21
MAIEVTVFKNTEGAVEKAIKILSKKLEQDRVLKEVRMKSYFEKPSDKRRRKQSEARRRTLRFQRKQQSRRGK